LESLQHKNDKKKKKSEDEGGVGVAPKNNDDNDPTTRYSRTPRPRKSTLNTGINRTPFPIVERESEVTKKIDETEKSIESKPTFPSIKKKKIKYIGC